VGGGAFGPPVLVRVRTDRKDFKMFKRRPQKFPPVPPPGGLIPPVPTPGDLFPPALPPGGTFFPAPLAYSVEEAAAMLGVGRTCIFFLIKEGQIKSVKIGRRRVVPATELASFLERNLVKPNPEDGWDPLADPK